MISYIIATIVAGAMILVAALIASAIQYKGGSNPNDPGKRKAWFWIIAVVNPIIFFLLGRFVLAPNPDNDQMVYDEYMKVLPIATAVGFVLYIIIGFIVSKVFRNGKLGHWF
jgi:methionine sulfoxide reductase heme-binding subunit